MPETGAHRDRDTELTRTLASFAVVMIHSTEVASTAGRVYNALARFSVPAFVLISGYYMLSRPVDTGDIFRRAGRLFAKLLVFGALQYALDVVTNEMVWQGWRSAAYAVLSGYQQLWYLYAAIALYLFTPVFSVFCAHSSRREHKFALMLMFLFGSVITTALRSQRFPLLEAVIGQMKVPYLLAFPFLYLMGDHLRRYPPRRPGRLIAAGSLGAIGTVIWTLALPEAQLETLSLSFFAPGNIWAGIGLFVAVKQLCVKRPQIADNALVRTLADCTEGIYLTHNMLSKAVDLLARPLPRPLSPWASLPLRALCVFFLSVAATWALRKLPGIQKLI